MRFFCEIGDRECLVEASTPEEAARQVAEEQAGRDRASAGARQLSEPCQYTVTVAEANEADLPLIAGDNYTVSLPAGTVAGEN